VKRGPRPVSTCISNVDRRQDPGTGSSCTCTRIPVCCIVGSRPMWHIAADYPLLFVLLNGVVENCFMPGISNPRKRQRTELQPKGASQPQSKRQKLIHHCTESQLPPAFWDNLSKIWLTKNALRELDRRNSQLAPSSPRSPRRRFHRPVTRRALAEREKNCLPAPSAANFLRHCGLRCLKDIKLSARRGGPDLADLRGVCISRKMLMPELITPFSTRHLPALLIAR
jgi:hypothetical protein